MFIEPQEFTSATELREHYAALKSRMRPKKQIAITIPASKSVEIVNSDLVEAHTLLSEFNKVSGHDILRATARVTGFFASDLKGPRRLKPLGRARFVFCYLCFKHTGLSYPAIGRIIGGRDHSTIMHAVKKVTTHMDLFLSDVKAVEEIMGLEGRLNSQNRKAPSD